MFYTVFFLHETYLLWYYHDEYVRDRKQLLFHMVHAFVDWYHKNLYLEKGKINDDPVQNE
jgi:hypothetical protein